MRSVSPLSNIYGFWHHVGILLEAAGFFQILPGIVPSVELV